MIPLFKVFGNPGIGAAVQRAFDEGFVSEGPRATEFEEAFAREVRADPARTVLANSCTSALHLAYDMVGVRPGTTVVASPMTCLAGLLPVVHLGGRILWADIDPLTGNITRESAKAAMDHDTKAVYGVLWGGDPFDPGLAFLRAPLIQDAAHGVLSCYHEGPLATLPNSWTCYSFQAIKTLTVGDGGALVCPDADMATLARRLRWFGLDRKVQAVSRWDQDISFPGYKMHMNDVNAAIGLTQLPYLQKLVATQVRNAGMLDAVCQNLKTLRAVDRERYGQSSCWLYTVLTPERDRLKAFLAARGIASDVVHVRCDTYDLFQDRDLASQNVWLPGVDRFNREHLCIPTGWWVTRRDVLDTIVPALQEFDKEVSK